MFGYKRKMEEELKQLILKNRKRTFEMFADAEDGEQDFGIECLQLKMQKQYENIGKIPGVKLQEAQRQRVLREIGVEGADLNEKTKYLDVQNQTLTDLKHQLLSSESALP